MRESLTIRERATTDDWVWSSTRCLLGESLLRQRNYREAEPLLLSSYEGLKASEAKIPQAYKVRIHQAGAWVVTLYEEWDRPEKAKEWKARLGLSDLPAEVFARP